MTGKLNIFQNGEWVELGSCDDLRVITTIKLVPLNGAHTFELKGEFTNLPKPIGDFARITTTLVDGTEYTEIMRVNPSYQKTPFVKNKGRKCSVVSCTKEAKAKGFCATHYDKAIRQNKSKFDSLPKPVID